MSYKVVEEMEMANLDTILSEDNLTTDAPEFTKTKENLALVRTKLTENKQTAYDILTEEKMKSKKEKKNLTNSVKEFYDNELATVKEEDKQGLKELNEALDQALVLIDKEEKIVDYLVQNKGMWTLENGLPVFTTQEKADGYNTLLQELISAVS